MIHRAWDWKQHRYLSPEESFDSFVDRESVRIDGLEHPHLSGADFFGYVQSLSEIAWAVTPTRAVGFGSAAATAAAAGATLEPADPYRMQSTGRAAGRERVCQ